MISIGTFARLGHVSVRMLRHYDAMGLLRPARVDPGTGYRYYEWTQLETLAWIEELKGFRVPLARIAELLVMDDDALWEALHAQRLSLYAERARLERTLGRLEPKLTNMEGNPMHQEYKVTIMDTPAQRIFGVRERIHIGQVHDLFQKVREQMKERGLEPAGAGLFLFHGEEFSYENMDAEAAFPVSEAHPDTWELPAAPYVATIHRGGYETVKEAYEAIGKYLAERPEWEILGPGIERYIRDENDGVPPEEYETGVLFPLKAAIKSPHGF